MTVKRPVLDLKALTSEQAAPMQEGVQRVASPNATHRIVYPSTANLEALAFKVSSAFRQRFRSRAVAADLKLNELLFEALDAWEEKHGLKN